MVEVAFFMRSATESASQKAMVLYPYSAIQRLLTYVAVARTREGFSGVRCIGFWSSCSASACSANVKSSWENPCSGSVPR